MLKAVTVTNFKGESCRMELQHPELCGFIISNIDGIASIQGNVNTTDLATGDGAWYNSSRLSTRNIVLTIVYWRQPSVEVNRHKMYRYFQLKRSTNLLFETDERTVQIDGYVENIDTGVFAQAEQSQISILCPDPYFYSTGDSQESFSGVRGLFEFPFSNESLTENLIEFGEIRFDTRSVLTYEGDADTGVTIDIHVNGEAEGITLYKPDTSERMIIDTDKIKKLMGSGLMYGDDILFSTIPGQKSIQLLRNGVYTNIIGALQRDSDWFQLSAGDNVFAFAATKGDRNLLITFTYRNTYGGV